MNPEAESKKKRPGPDAELISIHPICFDEAVDTLLSTKPKKKSKNKNKLQLLDETSPVNRHPAK
ncbi:MAG: hypothetical protein HY913_07205 [Desulfomonile tiedjei]|nr:hypothetical protein [Desulfomonile tiedjei]